MSWIHDIWLGDGDERLWLTAGKWRCEMNMCTTSSDQTQIVVYAVHVTATKYWGLSGLAHLPFAWYSDYDTALVEVQGWRALGCSHEEAPSQSNALFLLVEGERVLCA